MPGGQGSLSIQCADERHAGKVAGVDEIIMTTPWKRRKICASTLVAAKEAGVDRIYKAGGAQAIAALAFGT